MRLRLKPEEAIAIGLIPKPKKDGRNQRYSLSEQEFLELQKFRDNQKFIGIQNAANSHEIPIETIKHLWIKDKNTSTFVKNPLFNENQFSIDDIDFDKLFANIGKREIKLKSDIKNPALFDTLNFADTHLGMDASNKNTSLYGLSWNKDNIEEMLDEMINFAIESQKSNKLYITDFGDFLDGYNAETTRGGHKLPQNMTNNEAFEFGLDFKIKLVEVLLRYYEKIVFINICNDNHAGDFALILNTAFKKFAEKVFDRVEVINQEKFVDYYFIENYCFVKTHGKDKQHLKFGLKPKLDDKTINYITNMLNGFGLLNKGKKIIFEKGDSHIYLPDSASSDVFDYISYPAFSPSSDWVQHGFKKGQRGFVFNNYFENRQITHPYLIDN